MFKGWFTEIMEEVDKSLQEEAKRKKEFKEKNPTLYKIRKWSIRIILASVVAIVLVSPVILVVVLTLMGI